MKSSPKHTSQLVRLNKYLAMAGIASRRNADLMIQEGKVRVNGTTLTNLGVKIDPSRDKVFVGEKQVLLLDEPVYIVLNKPKDCITTASDERGRRTVLDYVKVKQRVFPVGRLDRNTTGTLLLTNDGAFAHRMMHPKFEVNKAYKVTLDKPLARPDGAALANGIRLSEGMTGPAEVVAIPGGRNKVIGIVIHEGRNKQVHRMFEALGYEVQKLDRVAYADITCDGLARGRWRYLTKGEVKRLMEQIGYASGETPTSLMQ